MRHSESIKCKFCGNPYIYSGWLFKHEERTHSEEPEIKARISMREYHDKGFLRSVADNLQIVPFGKAVKPGTKMTFSQYRIVA